MKLLIFTLFLGLSNAFTLPKIFKSGMVLQAEPTDAVIWGFLDGNTNPVDVSGMCSIKGRKFTVTKNFVPKEVHSVSYVYAVLPFYDVKCLCSRGRE